MEGTRRWTERTAAAIKRRLDGIPVGLVEGSKKIGDGNRGKEGIRRLVLLKGKNTLYTITKLLGDANLTVMI